MTHILDEAAVRAYRVDMTELITKDFERFSKDLRRMAKSAIPFAQANTLTQMGQEAQFSAKEGLDERFELRNRWTAGSIRSTRATPRFLESKVGSFRDYMADQEFGSTRTRNTGIPTTVATGEGQGARTSPRRKVVRPRLRKSRLGGLRVRQYRGSSRRQSAYVQAKLALDAGDRFALVETGARGLALYRVTRKGRDRIQMRMVYDFSNRQIRTKRNAWLRPAMEETLPKGQRIFTTFARQELARRRLLR